MQRESLEYDVVIVGAGPSGLAAAIRLAQLASGHGQEINVCVLEKGAEIGAHILSGAVLESRALDELIPDWRVQDVSWGTPVTKDVFHFFAGANKALRVPRLLTPSSMHNQGNMIISLGQLCHWLGAQAERLQVDLFPGFTAKDLLYNDAGAVAGVITGAMGVDRNGQQKEGFEPGMEIRAKYTIFAEGCRGHLGKQLLRHFKLDAGKTPQHYALGLKELWEVDAGKHEPGLVVHGAGWPLSETGTSGGSFLYHLQGNQIALGLIVDLNYSNPYLDPFAEFQRWKHHPLVKQFLTGGRRIVYGARAITKGGYYALPKMTLPGALLVGCDAGTLNFAKIKGIHTAMKSGMLAAESVFDAIAGGDEGGQDLVGYADRFERSWIYDELYHARNFGPALSRFGPHLGGVFNYLEQTVLRGRSPVVLKVRQPDQGKLETARKSTRINYPQPDEEISFSKLSSVYLSNTRHEEDQPCHLQLADESVAIEINLARYDAPEQRYCPAAVYEIVTKENGDPRLQINAQNCVHCKTCDIKDPTQNISWVPPEGGDGPHYPNM